MKLLAHFSKDPKLLQTFEEGHDSHGATAVNVLDLDCHPDEAKKLYPTERNIGKTLNFALMYGMSPFTLYFTLMDYGVNLEDPELQKKYGAYSGHDLASTIYSRYFKSYSGVKDLISEQKKKARENGFVETLLGRKIYLPDIHSNDAGKRSYSERLSTNGAIQGSAADVIMSAQVRLEDNLRLKMLGVEQLMQIHDEVLFQIPEKNMEKAVPLIVKLMENPFKGRIDMNVDLTVSYDEGASYFEAK